MLRTTALVLASVIGLGTGLPALTERGPAAGTALSAADSTEPWRRYFAGRWSCVGAFASGKPLAADLEFAPVLGGRWLEFVHVDRAPGTFQAQALWGVYPADTARLVAVFHDNLGGQRRFLSADRHASSVTFERDSMEPGARPERFVYRARTDSSFHFAWELKRQPGGPWVLGDSLDCRRR